MKTIVLEINEVPNKALFQFIVENKDSNIARYYARDQIIRKRILNEDVEEGFLYPSQVWASVHTGKPYSKHNCYWYSDPLKDETLLERVVKSNKTVASIGVLHSSKLARGVLERPSVRLFIPDSFGAIAFVYPQGYSAFAKLNREITSESGRKIRIRLLILQALRFALNTTSDPIKSGISAKSLYLAFKTLAKAVVYSEIELVRCLQFVFQSAILLHTIRQESPEACFLFSNHIAANMHRYWAATWPEDYDLPLYDKKWLRKKSRIIDYSIWLLDDLIGDIMSISGDDTVIILNSGMGQKANKEPDLDRSYDGKIANMKLFTDVIHKFVYERENEEIPMRIKNNMEPQYGIGLRSCQEAQIVAKLLREFCSSKEIRHRLDINDCEIVITIDFFRKDKSLLQMRELYGEYGFEFFRVDDHHTGKHSKEGLFWVIDPKRVVDSVVRMEGELRSTDVKGVIESIILA